MEKKRTSVCIIIRMALAIRKETAMKIAVFVFLSIIHQGLTACGLDPLWARSPSKDRPGLALDQHIND